MPNAILQGAIAEIVYRKAVEAMPEDVNFLVSLVKICSEFPFTQKLQDTMYQQWVQLNIIDSPENYLVLMDSAYTYFKSIYYLNYWWFDIKPNSMEIPSNC